MYFLHLNTCTSQQQHHHDQQQQARGFVKHTVHGSLLTQEGLLASHQQSHHQNNSFPVGNSTTSIVSFCDFITSKISKIYRLYTLVHLTKYIQLHTNLCTSALFKHIYFWGQFSLISETYACFDTSVGDQKQNKNWQILLFSFLRVAILRGKRHVLFLNFKKSSKLSLT